MKYRVEDSWPSPPPVRSIATAGARPRPRGEAYGVCGCVSASYFHWLELGGPRLRATWWARPCVHECGGAGRLQQRGYCW